MQIVHVAYKPASIPPRASDSQVPCLAMASQAAFCPAGLSRLHACAFLARSPHESVGNAGRGLGIGVSFQAAHQL